MAGNIDDDLYIRHLLQGTGYPEIGKIIKQVFDNVIPQKAIDFRTNVARIINQCLQMHGVPMFRTRYAKEAFPMNSVLLVCYASHNGKHRGVWLKDTPGEDIAMLRSKGNGYMTILMKYGKYAGPAPVGTVTIGGARFTGQAIVSEAVNQLEYFVNGERAPYEEFEKAWLREFPEQSPPAKPGYFRGQVDIFTITVPFIPWPERDIPALEKDLEAIEAKLKDALDDEEKAGLFYQGLKNDIEKIIKSPVIKVKKTEAALFSILLVLEGIIRDEDRHRARITPMIPIIKELRKTLELERYTGKRQTQQPWTGARRGV